MLYVGCSFCRATVPLWCAGQFMPHMPLPAMAGPMGVYCNMCGMVPPNFTCSFCWSRQMLFLPGVTQPPMNMYQGGAPANVAPVVQAQQGAPQSTLADLLKQAVGSFAQQAGKEAATNLFKAWG